MYEGDVNPFLRLMLSFGIIFGLLTVALLLILWFWITGPILLVAGVSILIYRKLKAKPLA